MASTNQTLATSFILLGFSRNQQTDILLFIVFCAIYLFTCIGNILMFFTIIVSISLHIPMYFFLCNLSFTDLCYSSIAAPKFLKDIFTTKRAISLSMCIFQLHSSLLLGAAECLILAVMAYDRFVAICNPLHYTVIMSWKICILLTVIIWSWCLCIAVVPSLIIHITFCNPNEIDHFMCESQTLVKRVCNYMYLSEIIICCFSFIEILVPFIMILLSYIYIISSILKLDSVKRGKVFSTCTSHLTMVILYYSSMLIMYSISSFNYFSGHLKYVSIIYVYLIPMLNPIVYCLKNQDVKKALRKLVAKKLMLLY